MNHAKIYLYYITAKNICSLSCFSFLQSKNILSANVILPLVDGVEHVGEHEALGGDGRQVAAGLLLRHRVGAGQWGRDFTRHVNPEIE